MSLSNTEKDEFNRLAARLNTAEMALADVRASLSQLYNTLDGPAIDHAKRSETIAVPPVQPVPPPARPKREPWWKQEAAVMKLVATGGVLITLAGVALLVALAIQNGLLGPLGRVLGAWLLAAIFLSGAVWIERKRFSPAGTIALTLTSLCTALITVIATVQLLDWWPPSIGALVSLVLIAGFSALARYWRYQALAILVAVGALCGLLVMWLPHYQHAAPPVVAVLFLLVAAVGRGWSAARNAAGILAIVGLILQSFQMWAIPHSMLENVSMWGAVLLLGLLVAVFLDSVPTTRQADLAASIGYPVGILLTIFWFTEKQAPSFVIFLLSCAMVAIGFTALGRTSAATGLVQKPLTLAGLCLMPVTYLLMYFRSPAEGHGGVFDRPLLVILFFLLACVITWWLSTQPALGPLPWTAWLIASFVITWEIGHSVFTKSPGWLTDGTALVQALLIGVFVGVMLYLRKALLLFDAPVRTLFGIGGLYMSALVIVTVCTWLLNQLSGQDGMWLGYLVGHALVSISWMLVAAYILVWSHSFSSQTSLTVGLVLAIAGIVKLVFFDLGALEGVPRVVAFLISGIALLAIASLRSRRNRADELGVDKQGG